MDLPPTIKPIMSKKYLSYFEGKNSLKKPAYQLY
jgi:hypothetical protein